ncbi:methyltransferase domain-containing protein [Candidatus Woesearchaeota archaeon]|nr:methyltransferase domain-containing protein [Candidatus Woesearchaeota archaeon]
MTDKKDNNNIKSLSYTDFISFIKEENRPSGGKNTVREILKNTFSSKETKVLEVGCTNGFSSLEIARTIKCQVVGIDINKESIKLANKRKNKDATISNLVTFKEASAYDIPFKDESFDLLFCGNATSFMDEKEKAIKEYKRVVKQWGFIATSPIFYVKETPNEIIEATSKEINGSIKKYTKKDWKDMFEEKGFEIYYSKDYEFKFLSETDLEEYVSYFLKKEHIKNLSKEQQNQIYNRWKKTISIFNENLKYTNFSIMILRKRFEKEEPEAFLAKEIK